MSSQGCYCHLRPNPSEGLFSGQLLSYLSRQGRVDLGIYVRGLGVGSAWECAGCLVGIVRVCTCPNMVASATCARLAFAKGCPRGPSIIMVYTIGYFGGLNIYHNDTWTLWVGCSLLRVTAFGSFRLFERSSSYTNG